MEPASQGDHIKRGALRDCESQYEMHADLPLLCIGVLCFLLLLTCSDCMTGIEEVRVWTE